MLCNKTVKITFKIFVVHLDEKPHLYSISERQARAWAKQKGKGFKVRGIVVRKNK